jgi:hypothetical protein
MTTDLHWRPFMQQLADADPAAVVIVNDGSGDYELAGTRYHCVPLTPVEQATAHQSDRSLLEAAGAVISAALTR